MLNRFPKNIWFPVLFFLFVGGLLIILRSCEPEKLPNGKAVADEVERRLVKRITGPMILQETQRVGDSLVRAAEEHMQRHLATTLDSGNFTAALRYRQLREYPALTAMAQHYQAHLGRVGKTWPNAATDPTSLLLQQQLQQYTAAAGQKQALPPRVIRVGPTELLYTKPIFLTEARCLRCHGDVKKNLSLTDQRALPANFARNYAGYAAGSWLGMWYVRFQAKGILDSITQKRKKSRRGQPLFSRDTVK